MRAPHEERREAGDEKSERRQSRGRETLQPERDGHEGDAPDHRGKAREQRIAGFHSESNFFIDTAASAAQLPDR
jgi:hypothetical protein